MSLRELPSRESVWRVIAIDTSRPRGSVAAGMLHASELAPPATEAAGPGRPQSARLNAAHENVLHEETLATPEEHARLLAAAIERTAAASGWHPREADLVAVVAGPGSFTGLRVGVTAAKMLAWAVGCRLVAISAFELAAVRGGPIAGSRWPDVSRLELGLDAGRGEVHAATAVRDPQAASRWRLSEPELLPQERWLTGLTTTCSETTNSETTGRDVCSVAVIPPEMSLVASRADLRHVLAADTSSTGIDVARLGLLHAWQAAAADPATLVPTYLRPSYAEERRTN